MDLIDLDLIVAVADAGSITGGAQKAHLSLPSSSARIRDVERTLGTSLFERHRRGVIPTASGTLLVRHARPILRDLERLRLELAEHGEGHGQTIRVAANVAASAGLLPAVTTPFLARHGDVRLDVDERPGHEVVRAVAERRADLGIAADSVDLGGLEAQVLRPDPLVLLAAPDDPLAASGTVAYADLLERPFVGLGDIGSFPLDERPSFRAKLANVDAVCDAVAAGIGVAILPRHAAAAWIAPDRVVAIELDEPWARRNLVLCFTTADELSAAAQEFREALAAATHGLPPDRTLRPGPGA
jgi:DNA-binding transcriptional LysR family regulator